MILSLRMMRCALDVVTGASGLLGSHVVEQLVKQGRRVRALVRSGSDTVFLESLGVEILRGSLIDQDFLNHALKGCNTLYHCAAKVGEWGPWRDFVENIIKPVESLVMACTVNKVQKVAHVSSITVYGHPKKNSFPINESAPTGQYLWRTDNYIRAKLQTEALWRNYQGEITILRPTWFFGPRDRTSLPRVLAAFRLNRIAQVGDGANMLNVLYAGDVANGVIKAGQSSKSAGKTYNLSNPGEITQKDFLALLADSLGYPRVQKIYSVRMAYIAGFVSEFIGKMILLKRPPHITRYSVGLVTRSNMFDISNAMNDLGWQPTTHLCDAVKSTIEWYFGSAKRPGPLAGSLT
ncbi:MAG: NAD-dependent epimerase/dehydratase family protein [Planctomycetes bacterium]|nr:NAD-dependent epimerase/dehydratase family protein [Planctomycetota bacterium]NBY02357.1 NAD-dependent epimerase/dehydratase family protein [Planctomycetota bacterium]